MNPGEEYVSPYAQQGSGFAITEGNPPSTLAPIIATILIIIITVLIVVLAPQFRFRNIGVILIILSVLSSMVVLPIISGHVSLYLAADEDDQNTWTIEELLGLQHTEGKLFGYSPGEAFDIIIKFDEIYQRQFGGNIYSGLGFEEQKELFAAEADGGAEYKIKEQIQLYFSLYEAEIGLGGAAIINVKVVNNSAGNPVPQWATEEGNNVNQSLGSGFGYRWVVPIGDEMSPTVRVIGIDYSYTTLPLILVPIGLGFIGFGISRWLKSGGWQAWRMGVPLEYLEIGNLPMQRASETFDEFDDLDI